jgi:hypothetical protein
MTSITQLLAQYFDAALAVFQRAAESSGCLARSYALAEHEVCVQFAGAEQGERVLAAMRHLQCARTSAACALTIHAWDALDDESFLPAPPWHALDYVERANMRSYRDARFSLFYDRGTDVFSAVDVERNIALYWTRDFDALPYYELAAPMRHLLHGWLQHQNCFVTHAAAVGTSTGAMLLAGRGGAGKSTTALACLRAGLRYAGDDFVLTSTAPPCAHSLYSSAKLNAVALDWMPELRQHVTNMGRLGPEKGLMFLAEVFPQQMAGTLPLKAIALPMVMPQRHTALTPIPAQTAYKAIAPDTTLRVQGDARMLLAALLKLVQRVPCYRLELGADLEQVPVAISKVL